MRRLLPAALLAAFPAAAQDEARWGPVAEELGIGSAVCTVDEDVVCAAVMCEEGGLTLGIMLTGHADAGPPAEGVIEIDGETFPHEMTGAIVNEDVLHLRMPVTVDEPVWARMRSGRQARVSTPNAEEGIAFTLRGSAVELDRVAAACD